MGPSPDEFPLLAVQGLYAANIRGNGNCLFNALSDQLYGNQDEHHRIRARVIEYMRDHAGYYKQFVDVNSGGGHRRNPKRKSAGAYSTPVSAVPPPPEQIDAVFESHLQQMAKGGTWGDNMEISAFSAAYAVDVKIYQRDFAYLVSGGEGVDGRSNVHIAYHVWQHYSSIRNIAGPHTGPPMVRPIASLSNTDIGRQQAIAKTPYIADWMIEVVMRSLPYMSDRLTIRRALEEHRGDVDNAVSYLLDAEERSSSSSATGSSSVERDQDSEDEAQWNGPNKKQDRRLSKASRTLQKEKADDRWDGTFKRKETKVLPPINNGVAAPMQVDQIPALKEEPEVDGDGAEWWPETRDDDTASSYSEASKMSATASSSSISSMSGATVPPSSRDWQTQKKPPPQKRITARERKETKKAAQKAAAKQRKQGKAGHDRSSQANGVVMKTGKANAPVVEQPFRTLYI